MRRRTHALTESLSRGAIRGLRALLVCVLGLTLAAAAGCGSADPSTTTIVAEVKGLSATANRLVVKASLDGKAAMQDLKVFDDLSHFGVRLPATTTGALVLTVSAYDAGQCRVAEGTVTVTVGAPYRFTVTVTMQALATPECPTLPMVPLDPAGCVGTFCWNTPLPQGNAYLGLWVTATTDAWAVGPLGTLAHYNGSIWSTVKSGVTTTLRGVWAGGAGEVWIVGDNGTILHYDGQTLLATPSGTTQALNAVWGDGTNVWAVGQGGTVLRYTAATKAWTMATTIVSVSLNSVWAQSPSAVFAVGAGGTVIKFNGTSFSLIASGTTTTTWNGVGGDAAQIYVVGAGGAIANSTGTGPFTMVNSNTTVALNSVWSPSTGQYIAVGASGTILRSSGAAWVTDPTGTTTKLNLNAVRSGGTSPIWIAGEGGTLLTFSGNQWLTVNGGKTPALRSIYGFSASDIWAVGESGTALHYDGSSWTANNPPGVTANLNSVWGSGPTNVWAVGDARTILQWTGTSWTAKTTGDTKATDLNGVWVPQAGEIWIAANTNVTNESHVIHMSAIAMNETSFSVNIPTFDAVWGSSNNDVWAMGMRTTGNGLAEHIINNTTLSNVQVSTRMRSLWGTGAADIWAVGDSGVQLHWDGTMWNQATTKTVQKLNSVWGTSTSSIWAVGDQGALLQYDGASWNLIESSGTRNNLQGLWGVSAKDVWTVGFAGSILHATK